MNIDVKIDARAIKFLGESLGEAVRRSVGMVGKAVQNQVLLNLQSRVLKVRSGGLINSWSAHVPDAVSDGKGGWTTTLKSNIAYAAIHEVGGEIVMKDKFLTIPTSEAEARVPYSERTAPRVIDSPGLAGCMSTFFLPTAFGGMIMGRLAGKGTKPIPLFILRERVTIPPRRYITLSIQQVIPGIPGIVTAQVAEVVREVASGGGAAA